MKSWFSTIIREISLYVVGGLFLWFGISMLVVSLKPGEDIYSINGNEINKGMHITGDIDFAYDYYASQSTERQVLGITTSTENDTGRWYIIPIYGDDYNESKLITVRVNPKDYVAMEKVVENTWAYLYGETDTFGQDVYHIDARVIKLNDELHQYYYDWYGRGYEAEADQYLVPYILVPTVSPWLSGVITVFGLLLFILGVVSTIRLITLGERS